MWLTCGFACRQTCNTVEFYSFVFSFKLKKCRSTANAVRSDKRMNDVKNKTSYTIIAVNSRAFTRFDDPSQNDQCFGFPILYETHTRILVYRHEFLNRFLIISR